MALSEVLQYTDDSVLVIANLVGYIPGERWGDGESMHAPRKHATRRKRRLHSIIVSDAKRGDMAASSPQETWLRAPRANGGLTPPYLPVFRAHGAPAMTQPLLLPDAEP